MYNNDDYLLLGTLCAIKVLITLNVILILILTLRDSLNIPI